MSKTWQELSQTNFGLIDRGDVPVTNYQSDDFFPPYDEAVKFMLTHSGWSREDYALILGPRLQDAKNSVAWMDGIGKEIDWKKGLINAKNRWYIGTQMSKKGDKMRQGELPDLLELAAEIKLLTDDEDTGLIRADQIDYENFVGLEPSGWKAIDDIVGGCPKYGLQVVYGSTGVGKSFWLAKRILHFLETYPQRTAGVYTLEMPVDEYMQRSIKMYPELIKYKDRLFVSGMATNMEQIVGECSTHRLDFVGIDFVDHLIQDEDSASAYAKVYKQCVQMGRLLRIPITMLAQPNRNFDTQHRFLRRYDVAWSSMAEKSAWQLIALQEFAELDTDDTMLPFHTDGQKHEYMIFWKNRGEWIKQQGPGAIILEGSKQKWSGKPWQNKLWLPGTTKIGTTKQTRQ